MVLPHGEERFRLATKAAEHIWSCNKDRRAGIWCVRTDASIVHFTLTQPVVAPLDRHEIVLADDLIAARDGTIWITTHLHGIERFSAAAKIIPRAGSKEMEHYGSREGLSGDHAFSLAEDREGSIWVVTTNGLDQFRTVPFTPVDLGGDATVALPIGKRESRMVIATDRLFDLTTGYPVPLTPFFKTFSRSLFESKDGTLWIGTSAGLLKYANGHLHPQQLPSLPTGSFRRVQAVTEDDRGGLWISLAGNGLYRFDGTSWQKHGGYDGLPEEPSACAYRDHEGKAWFGFLDGRAAQLSVGKVLVFSHSDGLSLGGIKVFTESNGHLWAGGDRGVAVLKSGTFHTLLLAGKQEVRGVTGLAFASDGALWINGGSGILRVSREELSLDDAEPAHTVAFEAFNYLDGVRGIPDPLYGMSSAWMAPDGRLYFATRTNLQWIDPLHIPHNAVPPLVRITAIKADDQNNAHLLRLRKLQVPLSRP
jgi:ligand-binding sensor domain-containing protein